MSPPPPPEPAIELSLLHYHPSQSATDHIARFEKLVSLAYPAASESRKWSLFAKTLTPPNFHSPPSAVSSSTTSGTSSQERRNHRRHASHVAESEGSPIRWLQQVERSQDIPFERVKELFVDRWTVPEEREPRQKAEKSGKRRSKSQPPPGWGAASKTSSVVSVDSTKARLGYESSVCDTSSTITTATTIVPSRSVVSSRSRSSYRHEADASESVKIGLSVLEREGAGNRIVLHFPDQKPRKRRGTLSRRSSPPLPASHPLLPGRPASTPFASSPFAPPPPPPLRMPSPPKRYSTPPLRAVQDISYVSRRGEGKIVVPTVRPIAIRPPAIKVPPRPTIEDVEDASELDLKAVRSTIGLPKASNAILEAVTPRGEPQIESYNNASREVNGGHDKAEEVAVEDEEEMARQRAEGEEKKKKRLADEERAREEWEREERLREERLKAQKLREERLREERLREERLREEKIRDERLREERLREEKARAERLREERMREEKFRAEKLREERLREERIREERLREERLREERIREERIREERLREERIRQERIREEKLRDERRKEQKLKEEQLKLERLREEVRMMKEQKEKERQEKLRLEKEAREKEERIRRERAEEEKRERERMDQERLEKERQTEKQPKEDVSCEEAPRELLPESQPSTPPLAPFTTTTTTPPPHLPLRSKTLLITNTNTPLGHQIGLTLASLGANIIAHYYHTSPSDPSIISLITQIRSLAKTGAGSVSIVYGDLGDGGRTVDGIVRRAVEAWGGVDGAIWCPPMATEEPSFMSWTPRGDATAGLVPFIQGALKRMIFQYHTTTTTTTTTITDPRPDFPIICISPHAPSSFSTLHSKSAIASVVQACAWEFAAYGVRVNSVGLGPAAAGDSSSLADVVDAVEWLVGPRSRGVNGVEVPIGGTPKTPPPPPLSPCPTASGWW